MLLYPVQPVSADVTLDMEEFGSFSEMFDALPNESGKVTLKISKNKLKDFETRISIPEGHGITEFTIEPSQETLKVSWPELERICANGIPLGIGEGLLFENASVYGGSCVSGEEKHLKSSVLTVSGTVGFVFGGGFAEEGGLSEVSETSVTLTNSAVVYYEVFGGGHASGSGSRVISKSTTLKISGTTDYVLGGGFAENGGLSECAQTDIMAKEGSDVPVALFTGGSASGSGSLSTVDNAKAVVEGKANWVFSGDFAFGGGETKLNEASRLEISSTGTTEIAYMGSFSSDPGSNAYVNTSELMNCGNAGQIYKDTQTADGGDGRTLVKALFPCTSGEAASD